MTASPVSKRRGYALGLVAAALVGTAVTVILSGHVVGGNRAANDAGTTGHTTGAPPARHPRRRSSWIAAADAVCRLGRKLYPSIARGANGDPDTLSYAVERLVKEIAAIPFPAADSARQRRLARHGRAAASAWQSLATRPIGDVTLREREHAGRLGARYVDELVALGAGACAPLRQAAPQSSGTTVTPEP